MPNMTKALYMARHCGGEAAANNERRSLTAEIWQDILIAAQVEKKTDFASEERIAIMEAFAAGFDTERATADAF